MTILGNTEITPNGIFNMVGGTVVHINASAGLLLISGGTLGSSGVTQSGIEVSGSARLSVSGTVIVNNLSITGSTPAVTVSGGTIENMTLDRTERSIVRILNGTVKKLSIGSNASVSLHGGIYEEIISASAETSIFENLLGGEALDSHQRYLFRDENGKFLNETVSDSGERFIKSATAGTSFTIVHHACAPVNSDSSLCSCGRTLVLKIQTGENIYIYNNLLSSDALNYVMENGTVTLLSDALLQSQITMPTRNFTLDLGGHKITPTSDAMKIFLKSSMTLTGTVDGLISSEIDIWENGNLNIIGDVKAERISLFMSPYGNLTVNSNATIGTLSVYGNPKTRISLGAGTKINAFSFAIGESYTLLDLLADGYAFTYEDGSTVKLYNANTQSSSGKTLTVATHSCNWENESCACGRICLHGSLDDNGVCTVCRLQFAARLTDANGAFMGWYKTLGEAYNAATGTDYLITLADDATEDLTVNRSLNLNLNGHALRGNLKITGGAEVTVKGAQTGSAVTGTVTAESGTLNIKGGSYTALKETGGTVKLYGGHFDSIERSSSPVGELLAKDYAFKRGNAFVSWSDIDSETTVSNVDVKHCEHFGDTRCNYCNEILKAKLVNNDTESFYTSFQSALNAIPSSGETTIMLISDCGTESTSYLLNGKRLLLNLNDHTLLGKFVLSRNDNLIITTGNGTLSGIEQNGGSLTVNAWNATVTQLTVSGGSTLLDGGNYGSINVTATGKTVDSILAEYNTYYRSSEADAKTWLENTGNRTLSNVSVGPIPIRTVSISAPAHTVTYPNSITLSVSESTTGSGVVTYQWYEIIDSVKTDITGADSASYTVSATGTHILGCKVTLDGYTKSAETSVTVNKAANTTYVEAATELIFNANPQNLIRVYWVSEGCTVKYKTDRNGTYSTDIPTATNAGTYTVYYYIDGGAYYESIASEANPNELTVIIDSRDLQTLNQYGTSVYQKNHKRYDGNTWAPDFKLSLVARESRPDPEIVLTEGTDYTVSVTPQTDAGRYTAVFTGKGNYKGTYTYDWNIDQADAPAASAGKLTVYNKIAHTYTVSIASLLPSLPEGCEYKDISCTVNTTDAESSPSEITAAEYFGDFVINNGILTVPVNSVDSNETGVIATLRITVTTKNYNTFMLTLNISRDNRISPIYVDSPIADITKDDVTGDKRDTLGILLDDLNDYLSQNPCEDEKNELENLKASVNELIDLINAAKDAMENEIITKADGIDASNAKPSDKATLESAQKAVEDALEAYGKNYTESEKLLLNGKLARIELALTAIKKAEQSAEGGKIDNVQDNTVKPTDKPDTNEDIAQTGDKASPIIWIVVLAVAVVCLLVLTVTRKKKQ